MIIWRIFHGTKNVAESAILHCLFEKSLNTFREMVVVIEYFCYAMHGISLPILRWYFVNAIMAKSAGLYLIYLEISQ